MTTDAHGDGIGEDLKGTTNSPSSGNPSHCHMRTTSLHINQFGMLLSL
jgi:hypothetical protein